MPKTKFLQFSQFYITFCYLLGNFFLKNQRIRVNPIRVNPYVFGLPCQIGSLVAVFVAVFEDPVSFKINELQRQWHTRQSLYHIFIF